MIDFQATIVFQQNWDAINAVNEDGSRKYRYIINKGSSRSSKTISLIDVSDTYCRLNPNKRGTVWRDTKTDCKKTVLVDMLKRLKSTGRYKLDQDFNKTESIFYYSNDTTFEIHGTDDEETVHGLTQSFAWFNEPYSISIETFNQIDQRTSDFIFIDYNPKKGHWVENLMKDPRALVIHSTFKDNPFCPIESKIKIQSYQPVSKSRVVLDNVLPLNDAKKYDCESNPLKLNPKYLNELIRCIDNERKNSANEFNWDVYGLGEKAEKPNRIFSWKKITRAEYDALDCGVMYGVDWGKVDPWGIVEAKFYDGTLYLRELNYKSENELRKEMNVNEYIKIGEDVEGTGIVVWMFERLGISKNAYIVCDNNRPLKIAALRRHGWEYAIPAEKPKGSIIDGIDLLQNIQVCFTDDSPNIEYEQENYSWKTDRYGINTEEPEDVDNHTIDPTRYIGLFLQSKGLLRVL